MDYKKVLRLHFYSMPRKYLRKQLEVRASDDLLYVYNLNGDLVRTHRRSHTPKD